MKTHAIRFEHHVLISSGRRRLNAILRVPAAAVGAVILAHADESGRFGPRSRAVSDVLDEAGIATLSLDLLDGDEVESRLKVVDVELLANRLQHAADWLADEPETRDLPLGYFGGGTAASAALLAAARYPAPVRAVVSRGGRTDLVEQELRHVRCPTMLIASDDESARIRNQGAFDRLGCPKHLVVIPGAGHEFAEPGAIEEVARLTRDWFGRHVVYGASPNAVDERPSARIVENAAK